MAAGNNEYTPTCAASCGLETLVNVGDTDCANELSLELAEISELFINERTATYGEPEKPITGWVENADNAAVITTWYGAKSNSGTKTVKFLYGLGEKGEPTETTITLHKGKTSSVGTRHQITFTINLIDATTYSFLRKLQSCRGIYHVWFATDVYLYGGKNGIIADIEKVVFLKTGGRGDNAKAVITIGWNATADPVRDAKTWSN